MSQLSTLIPKVSRSSNAIPPQPSAIMEFVKNLKARRRQDYRYHLDYRTRCLTEILRADSVIYAYLIEKRGFHPPTAEMYGVAVDANTEFFSSIAYPAVAELGLRVNKLGKSSVTYEVGIFERGVEEVKAVSQCVHVFVERSTGRPSPDGMSITLRGALENLVAEKRAVKL
ncbi:uncharacterized protein N7496_000555 [Penicillium cataractarum]|uniref:Thioesterase domain-containing protein n=1 Tax=Penicillium cataractarum TaxID=2100454 RepID=A0A9W9VU99_9EURO|nr:uncharacterized protein N7496_000555 [Penicillium cataractarum]KAJ5389487.1 hypothetical protein N7496_000555 [Penicillium cataractarum]